MTADVQHCLQFDLTALEWRWGHADVGAGSSLPDNQTR